MKQFISVHDVPNVQDFVGKAIEIKKNPFANQHLGKNKTIGLVFFNPSLRTRLSSQKAAFNLSANCWVLNAGADSWQLEMNDGTVMENTQEHVKEAIMVMSAYCDIIAVRTFPTLTDKEQDYCETIFNKIVQYATVPIVSLESATRHPLQSFADLITIEEHRPKDKKIKVVLTWAPHPKSLPQAVPNSFAEWATHIPNAEFVITHPKGYELAEHFVQNSQVEYNQDKALEGADFVYTKNWSSYKEYGKRLDVKENWMITAQKMAQTNEGKFMHCLPVRRNVIVADEVIDSKNSIVIPQATNRIYAAQTVFQQMLEGI
jgi:N-succinyl-L-ornithine transcarbamylase